MFVLHSLLFPSIILCESESSNTDDDSYIACMFDLIAQPGSCFIQILNQDPTAFTESKHSLALREFELSITSSTYSSDSSDHETNMGSFKDNSLSFTKENYVTQLDEIRAKLFVCVSRKQATNLTFKVVQKTIPEHVWAKTAEELSNNNVLINQYLDNFANTIDLKDDLDLACLFHVRAATSTLNAALF